MLKSLYILLYFFLGLSVSLANTLQPSKTYNANGSVTDIIASNNKIYVSTNVGEINIFDKDTTKLLDTIKIPKIKDFMGDVVDAKIYNLDLLHSSLLFTVQASKGYREVYLYKNNLLSKVIDKEQKLIIGKSKFIDENHITFATLGNEFYLFDIKQNKKVWQINVRKENDNFNSKFSDFTLNEDKSLAVVSDESGDLKVIDIKKAQIVKYLEGQNLDNVFKVDFKNNKIITAGQDGRCVIYDLTSNKNYYLKKRRWFLIYAAALSPNANLGAYSSDENNNVTVFNTKTKKELALLTNNLMTLTSILFINKDEIFVTTDSNKFNYYNLKGK